jgi:hypothetical protein
MFREILQMLFWVALGIVLWAAVELLCKVFS